MNATTKSVDARLLLLGCPKDRLPARIYAGGIGEYRKKIRFFDSVVLLEQWCRGWVGLMVQDKRETG